MVYTLAFFSIWLVGLLCFIGFVAFKFYQILIIHVDVLSIEFVLMFNPTLICFGDWSNMWDMNLVACAVSLNWWKTASLARRHILHSIPAAWSDGHWGQYWAPILSEQLRITSIYYCMLFEFSVLIRFYIFCIYFAVCASVIDDHRTL